MVEVPEVDFVILATVIINIVHNWLNVYAVCYWKMPSRGFIAWHYNHLSGQERLNIEISAK